MTYKERKRSRMKGYKSESITRIGNKARTIPQCGFSALCKSKSVLLILKCKGKIRVIEEKALGIHSLSTCDCVLLMHQNSEKEDFETAPSQYLRTALTSSCTLSHTWERKRMPRMGMESTPSRCPRTAPETPLACH